MLCLMLHKYVNFRTGNVFQTWNSAAKDHLCIGLSFLYLLQAQFLALTLDIPSRPSRVKSRKRMRRPGAASTRNTVASWCSSRSKRGCAKPL